MSAAKRTLSIGGASFDLFVTSDAAVRKTETGEEFVLPLGDKRWISTVRGCVGGGAANSSVGLARLGCNAGFCGVIADDQWGTQILEQLKKEDVNCDSATIVERESSNFAIILSSPEGERVILAHQGSSRHLHDVTFDKETAGKMDWIYLNHIHADSSVIEDDLIEILTTEPHSRLTWNPGGKQIQAGMREPSNVLLLRHTHFIQMNKEEAFTFTGRNTIEHALRTIREAGTAIVCITDGKRGSWVCDATHLYRCTTPETPVVDTTGAGDAFGTAFTWALTEKKDLPTALRAGTINAMSVIGAVGAQTGLLTDTEMHSRLQSLQIPIEVSSL